MTVGDGAYYNDGILASDFLLFAYLIHLYYLVLRRFVGRLGEVGRIVLILGMCFTIYYQAATIASGR